MNAQTVAVKGVICIGFLFFGLFLGGCAHPTQFVPQPTMTVPESNTEVTRICFAIEADVRGWMVSNFGLMCPYAVTCNGKGLAIMKTGSFIVWDQPVNSVDRQAQISVRFRNGGLVSYKHTLPLEAGRISRLILKFGLTQATFRELDASEWEKVSAGYPAADYKADAR